MASSLREDLTIAAPATGPAPAGVGIIRISGSRSAEVLKEIFSPKGVDPAHSPWRLCFGQIREGDHPAGEIDHGFAVYMPAPYTFTGEDVVELQLHGSPLIIKRALSTLYKRGVAPALPGESTKRAFLNGKLDLIQSEALCDTITAVNDRSLELAKEQLAGRLSDIMRKVAEPLRDSLAELEAHLDFPEEDITPASVTAIGRTMNGAAASIGTLIASYQYGATVKEGLRVLLCGVPNVGKSSLLNALLGHERAIVTDIPGTTRDVIEEAATYRGFQFVFCDSAGLRDVAADLVEARGIELARNRLSWADVVLAVVDATCVDDHWSFLHEELRDHLAKVWIVQNKVDLTGDRPARHPTLPTFQISAHTKYGLDDLWNTLTAMIQSYIPATESTEIVTNERHKTCLEQAHSALIRAHTDLTNRSPLEIVAAELRQSLRHLDELVGVTYTEDILERIFSRFCIGK